MKRAAHVWLCSLLAIALASAALPSLSATPWPDLPAPPAGKVEWVAKEVWVNGIQSRIQKFDSPHSSTEVLAHYRAHWRSGDAGPAREDTARGWRTISTLRGPYSLVVQVKPKEKSGSEGLISILNIKAPKLNYRPHDWPEISGLEVYQVMESFDRHLHSIYVLARSLKSLDHVRDQMKGIWSLRGWHLQHEHLQPSGYLGAYALGRKTMEMAITQDARQAVVTVVVNVMQAGREGA